MLAIPGTLHEFGRTISREAAERVARDWWQLLLNGLLLIVSGMLIFSIDWTIRSLATFIGALFIFQGLMETLNGGIDAGVRRANVATGLLSIAAGVAIVVWPSPGLLVLGVFLGAWLIIVGTVTVSASLAARRLIPNWWLLLITGLLEIPLGVLALADPGSTLAALITVGGIWAVVVGVMRTVISFELKRLPEDVDRMLSAQSAGSDAAAQGNGAGNPVPHGQRPRNPIGQL
jgi:uncharacterized membrane protein HdeD (DUF308 family)